MVHGDQAAFKDSVYGYCLGGSQLAAQSLHTAASIDADLDTNTSMRADYVKERHLADIIRIVR